MCDISKPVYIKIKDKLINLIGRYIIQSQERIGGIGTRVQIDETAICRGRIILNPSSRYDETPGI